mgnify:CR=1 FL=1
MHITGKIQKIWAFFLALIMLAAALALSVSAEDTRFDGKSWEEIMEDFLAERGVNTDRITIGYENLVSGESGYFQGDRYMVACSVRCSARTRRRWIITFSTATCSPRGRLSTA